MAVLPRAPWPTLRGCPPSPYGTSLMTSCHQVLTMSLLHSGMEELSVFHPITFRSTTQARYPSSMAMGALLFSNPSTMTRSSLAHRPYSRREIVPITHARVAWHRMHSLFARCIVSPHSSRTWLSSLLTSLTVRLARENGST